MSDPIREYAFGVKSDDGSVAKFTVMLLESGCVRILTSDKNGAECHDVRWNGSAWEDFGGRSDSNIRHVVASAGR